MMMSMMMKIQTTGRYNCSCPQTSYHYAIWEKYPTVPITLIVSTRVGWVISFKTQPLYLLPSLGKSAPGPIQRSPPPPTQSPYPPWAFLSGTKNYVYYLRHKATPNVKLVCLGFRKTTRWHFAAAYPDTYILVFGHFLTLQLKSNKKRPDSLWKWPKGKNALVYRLLTYAVRISYYRMVP
jgi:hypothetical protein